MYFSQEIEEILEELGTKKEGLTREEAKKRLIENGKNILPSKVIFIAG